MLHQYQKTRNKSKHMKLLFTLCFAAIVTFAYSQFFTTQMCASSNGVNVNVQRGADKFKLRLPDLSLEGRKFANLTCAPSTSANCPTDRHGNQYCFSNGQIQKKDEDGNVLATAQVSAAGTSSNILIIDPHVPNTLHVTTWSCMRGCTNQVYSKVAMDKMTVVAGPVTLPNSAISGCPVEPQYCATFDIQFTTATNDYLIYGYRYSQNLTYYVGALNTRCVNSGIKYYQLPQAA